MVWIYHVVVLLSPWSLIRSAPIVSSPPRTLTRHSKSVKYLWLNMFLPTKILSIPVYHISWSGLRMENWKQAEIYLWILTVQEFTYHTQSKATPRYHLSSLLSYKTFKCKLQNNLHFSNFLDWKASIMFLSRCVFPIFHCLIIME